jgi:biopolymer transport protein ExbD
MRPFLKPQTASSAVDVTPLLDIVFQLLLFFILTSAFIQPALSLDLPGSGREHEKVEADLLISIDPEGRFFLNHSDKPLGLDELEEALRIFSREKPEASLVIRGDRQVSYGAFFELIDTARSAGIKTVSLAHEPTQEP